MKFSHSLVIISFLLFFSCEKEPKRLLVRPLEKDEPYSIYTTVVPIDTHPCVQFGEQCGKQTKCILKVDTVYVYRIRNQIVGVGIEE